MNNPCKHTITRDGVCERCSQRVWAVHDRECRRCAHFRDLPVGPPICRRHLMRVTADMHVTYRIGSAWQDGGLCFEGSPAGAMSAEEVE